MLSLTQNPGYKAISILNYTYNMATSNTKTYQADVIIAGAGIAGLTAALKLLQQGKSVIILDKSVEQQLGGLALEAAGGIHLINTPEQRRLGIKDSPECAFDDWQRLAQFNDETAWGKKWAQFYCHNSIDYIYQFTREINVRFVPSPMWIQRGVFETGNSYPRWHLVWGTGFHLVQQILKKIEALDAGNNLIIYFEHDVTGIQEHKNNAEFTGMDMRTKQHFSAIGDNIIIATGGVGGGDLSTIRNLWSDDAPALPDELLNGAHIFADGQVHRSVQAIDGLLTNMQSHWVYPAGVHHPEQRKPHDGMAVTPCPSALWLNAQGHRFNIPMSAYADMKTCTYEVMKSPGGYSWQILNYKIAIKELTVQLSRYFTAIRERQKLKLLRNVFFGDKERIAMLMKEAPDDVLIASNLDELLEKMQQQSLYDLTIDRENVHREVNRYDAQIKRGSKWHNDESLRRLANLRRYKPEKVRLCNNQPIIDPKAMPLMAIRQFPITRKSLGGIETDLDCHVLKTDGSAMTNIFAIGEAAGYGGGGLNGGCSPEGTFLGGCLLTALKCAQSLK